MIPKHLFELDEQHASAADFIGAMACDLAEMAAENHLNFIAYLLETAAGAAFDASNSRQVLKSKLQVLCEAKANDRAQGRA
jgi:hypothetical protein